VNVTATARELSKPKAKRIAYTSMHVASPFAPNWSALFSANDQKNDDAAAIFCVLRGAAYMEPFFSQHKFRSKAESAVVPTVIPTLICVRVKLPRRGNIEPNAMVQFPFEVHHRKTMTSGNAQNVKKTDRYHDVCIDLYTDRHGSVPVSTRYSMVRAEGDYIKARQEQKKGWQPINDGRTTHYWFCHVRSLYDERWVFGRRFLPL
jgi:hypothetical protein